VSKRYNVMGSEVVDGSNCKPVVKDPEKPIMHYASHLLICDGERCNQLSSDGFSTHLRDIIKALGFERGENRIKITVTK